MPLSNQVYHHLIKSRPGVLALFDPDRMSIPRAEKLTRFACDNGAQGILVGSSILVTAGFERFLSAVKRCADKPIILFPGGTQQLSPKADALFFLSLISGRNPELIIGEHVRSAFLIREFGLEVIPVGYILIESGNYTSVEFMSNSKPLPRTKWEICAAHALAGQYLGMKFIYLEAGSGARQPVPAQFVSKVRKIINIPLIVGGGIRTVGDARRIIDAGADYIVLGSILERSPAKFRQITRSIR